MPASGVEVEHTRLDDLLLDIHELQKQAEVEAAEASETNTVDFRYCEPFPSVLLQRKSYNSFCITNLPYSELLLLQTIFSLPQTKDTSIQRS